MNATQMKYAAKELKAIVNKKEQDWRQKHIPEWLHVSRHGWCYIKPSSLHKKCFDLGAYETVFKEEKIVVILTPYEEEAKELYAAYKKFLDKLDMEYKKVEQEIMLGENGIKILRNFQETFID